MSLSKLAPVRTGRTLRALRAAMLATSVLMTAVGTTVVVMPSQAAAQLFFDWGGQQKVNDTGRVFGKFDTGKHKVGEIIVSFSDRRLYYITAPGEAVSYPIAIPREQDRWQGSTTVTQKRENPSWTPTPTMIKENPKLPRWVPGGHPMNPLGNRALYLGSSFYRIHGTDAPWTIGTAVSKGCIRMYNKDALDVYERSKVGAKVLVTWNAYKFVANPGQENVAQPAAEPQTSQSGNPPAASQTAATPGAPAATAVAPTTATAASVQTTAAAPADASARPARRSSSDVARIDGFHDNVPDFRPRRKREAELDNQNSAAVEPAPPAQPAAAEPKRGRETQQQQRRDRDGNRQRNAGGSDGQSGPQNSGQQRRRAAAVTPPPAAAEAVSAPAVAIETGAVTIDEPVAPRAERTSPQTTAATPPPAVQVPSEARGEPAAPVADDPATRALLAAERAAAAAERAAAAAERAERASAARAAAATQASEAPAAPAAAPAAD